MKEQLSNYAESLYKDFPVEVLGGVLLVLCVGVLIIVLFEKFSWRKIARLILIEYVFLIYCSTVIFRIYSEERGFNLTPFWSYEAIINGDDILLPQIIMNIIVFIPIGILLCAMFAKGKLWKTIGLGCLLSISIEVSQFLFKRGFSEVDDVMHNTFGCLIGYLMVMGVRFLLKGCG